jgi:hypothetical protein
MLSLKLNQSKALDEMKSLMIADTHSPSASAEEWVSLTSTNLGEAALRLARASFELSDNVSA